MKKILSSHHIFASSESQEFVANVYAYILEHGFVNNQELKGPIEFSLAQYDKVKMLPTLDDLRQETGFEPSGESFSDETVALYSVARLERECRIMHFRKSLTEAAALPSHDEMMKKFRELYESFSLVEEEREAPSLGEIMESVITRDPKTAQEGAKTNIPNLDKVISPIQKGYQLTVCGAPSHGKSCFADNFLYVNSIQGSMKTLYLSLELPKDIVAAKILARHSYELFGEKEAIPYTSIMRRQVDDDRLRELIADLKDKAPNVHVLDVSDRIPFYPPSDFGVFLERQFAKEPFDILIIDYLQIIKSYSRLIGYENYEFMNSVVSMIRRKTVSIGENNMLITLLLSQTNRTGYDKASKRDGKYESLSAIAEVNALERDSQLIVFLHLDDICRSSREIRYQLLKNRDGPLIETPQVTYFDGAYSVVGESQIYSEVFSDESLSKIDGESDFLDDAFGPGDGMVL